MYKIFWVGAQLLSFGLFITFNTVEYEFKRHLKKLD